MTIKKVISFAVCTAMLLGVSFTLATGKAFAAISVSKVAVGTQIDSKYAFTPRFIPGKTTFEGFGGYSYTDDLWETDDDFLSSANHYPIRLTSTSQKGNVGVWYKNVGTYQGKVVNMKVTVSGWDALRKNASLKPYGKSYTKTSYPMVVFAKYNLGVWQPTNYIKNLKIKVDFYDMDGNALKISGHITFRDMDATEKLTLHNSEKVYLKSNSILKSSGNYITGNGSTDVTNSDTFAWSEVLLDDVSSFTYNYSRYDYDAKTDWSTKAHTTRSCYYWALEPQTITSFTTPSPTISGQKEAIAGKNYDVWQVNFFVPMQPSSTYYYKKFVLTDTLPEPFSFKSAKITDDTGADVTDKFMITCDSSNKLTATLGDYKSNDTFYNKSYTMTINGCFEDKDYKDYKTRYGIAFNNCITLTANNSGTDTALKTETVTTTLLFWLNFSTDTETVTVGNASGYKSYTYLDGCNSIQCIISSAATTRPYLDFTINYSGRELRNIYINGDPILDENEKLERSDSGYYSHNYNILKENTGFTRLYEMSQYIGSRYLISEMELTKNTTVYVTTRPLECELEVTKNVAKENINIANGKPVAIFICEGSDVTGAQHTFIKAAQCTKNFDGDYTGTVKFTGIPAGKNYEVKEINQARFNCSLNEVVDFISADIYSLKATITDDTENNIQKKWQYFGDNDLVINSFKN